MRVHLCGVRGSTVRTGSAYAEYGGDTTCLLLRGKAGERVLLDGGSGTIGAGELLSASPGSRRLLVLMTHYHLDHVAGLPSLPQLYDPDWSITFTAPVLEGRGVESALTPLLAPPYWPIDCETMGASIRFIDMDSSPLSWGGFDVRSCPLPHPGGATAYRVDEREGGGAMILATDGEWPLATKAEREDLRALCENPAPAALLVCDGQFDDENYEVHRGWGHGRANDAVALAQEAGVARLLVTHHSPEDDDRSLARRDEELGKLWSGAALARQGEEIEL